jgi:hypothetical protein
MGDNQAVSESVEAKLERLDAENKKMRGELKGLKGQQGLIRAKIGLGAPSRSPPIVDSSPTQATTEPSEAETSPMQAAKPEYVRRWEKSCPDCGGENSQYQKPNVFCNGPECKGVIPLGTIDPEKDVVNGTTDKVKACWNCGAKGENLHVVVRK